jgi:hypothetical protein
MAVLSVVFAMADGFVSPGSSETDTFTFARIRYDSIGGYGESWYRHEGRDWERWETDYPRAELNLITRLKELTSISVSERPRVIRLTDKNLGDYPFIFMSDVGWMRLSVAERDALEVYLLKGGFLWVDDFWGDAEWDNLAKTFHAMERAWEWKEIPQDHAILRVVYPMEACPQIPARIFYQATGLPFDPPGVHRFPAGGTRGVNRVNFRGLFDSRGRLMAVATHNTDVADGWEREGESKEFFDLFSVDSYAISINIIVYAMTH